MSTPKFTPAIRQSSRDAGERREQFATDDGNAAAAADPGDSPCPTCGLSKIREKRAPVHVVSARPIDESPRVRRASYLSRK
jgi:hypothetical protein